MSSDPLSFFTATDSDEDDSDCLSENGSPTKETSVVTALCETTDSAKNANALPPPLLALANAKTPEFVTSHVQKDMNWDKLVKEAPYVVPKEFKPWETSLPSVESKPIIKSHKPDLTIVKQVPQTLAPSAPKVEPKKGRPSDAQDHAVMWSKMYKDSGFDSISAKRPRPEDEDEDLAGFCHTDLDVGKVAFQAKHQKTSETSSATFQKKEKRKRDAGQANREKMFVEEEKRILRQSFKES